MRKEIKYLEAVELRRANFTPFIVVDGALRHEANQFLKHLTSLTFYDINGTSYAGDGLDSGLSW